MPVSIPRRPGCHGHFCRGARAKGWKEVQDTVREGERQGFSFLGTLFKQLLPCSTPLFLLLGFVFSFAPVSLLRRVTRRADVEGDERPDGLRQQPGHADRGLDCGRGAHHDDVPHGEAKGDMNFIRVHRCLFVLWTKRKTSPCVGTCFQSVLDCCWLPGCSLVVQVDPNPF